MDTIKLISSNVGVELRMLNTTVVAYTAFKRTNVDRFFKFLLKSNIDLSRIGQDINLQRYFFSAIDAVTKESNIIKIEAWKNAVIHLATDFQNFEYTDNFFKILSDLTVFDLTMLYKIYSTEFDLDRIDIEIFTYSGNKKIKSDYVMLALKRLASSNLVNENYMNTFSGLKEDPFSTFIYYKNGLGKEFLLFVSSLE